MVDTSTNNRDNEDGRTNSYVNKKLLGNYVIHNNRHVTYCNTVDKILINNFNKDGPMGKTLRRLHELRDRHNARHCINNYPHPQHTNKIIYALYNMQTTGAQAIYIGKTSKTALSRRLRHIAKAKADGSHPLSKWIQHIGSDNLGIFPLMQLHNWDLSHHYERKWIHKLQTHIKHNRWGPMNISLEHSSSHKHSIKMTNLLHTIHFLITYKQLEVAAPPSIQHFSIKKLYRILSILINKRVTTYKQPDNKLIITQIHDMHKTISTKYTANHISILAEYINAQIDAHILRLRTYGKPTRNKSMQPINITVFQYFSPLVKTLPLNRTIHEATKYLPQPLKLVIQPKIVYTKLRPTSSFLFNFKDTIEEIDQMTLSNLPPCNCSSPQLQPFTRTHGHVDTLDLNILNHVIGNTHHSKLLQKLMEKGAKYIETPHLTYSQIFRRVGLALDNYVEKLIHKFPSLKTDQFAEWKQYIMQQLESSTPSTYRGQPVDIILNTPHIKSLVQQLHKQYVVNTGDKVVNNYSITCKTWWTKTLLETTINSRSYKVSSKTADQVIQRHQTYLQRYGIPSGNQLPVKRIQCKYHKDEIRPLVSATCVTTTTLTKFLTTAIQALLDTIKAEASLFERKTGFNYYFDIQNTGDLSQFIELLNNNPDHQPKSVISADAAGMYDSFEHFVIRRLLTEEIPDLFT